MILIGLVRVYRWVLSPAKSVLFGPFGRCRFTPSCSAYALEALRAHGAMGGSWLALRRLCRCHPWGGCGLDAVPARGQSAAHPSEGLAARLTLHFRMKQLKRLFSREKA
jgi:putative membrane protein insertion efficiency factor